jgi:hypothetical protein
VIGGGMPSLRTDGSCLVGTLRGLGSGSKAMPPESIAKIKQDALDLLGRIVAAYVNEIAVGEVGADGSAVASDSMPSHPCTGLLYGRIQSGKTVAMIALVAAAIDNGFRVVVVLTSDNVKLVSQTTERFAALEGPITLDALNPEAWSNDAKHIGKHIPKAGVVFVCSKNNTRLEELIAFLKTVGAVNHPALILDDEADQATLDTNLARSSRAKEKGKPGVDPTAIYTRVADELRAALRHHVFIQVTATPYALLLQSVGTKLRPSFTRLLEPGIGYTGGESFFEEHHLDGPNPPLVFVAKDESASILEGATDTPDGLRRAIAFFLVAAGTQAITDPDTANAKAGQNFLCHTSQLRKQHSNLENLVRLYIDRVSDNLDAGSGEGLDKLALAYEELRRTMPNAPSFAEIVENIKRRLVNRKIVVVNAEAETETGRGLNFTIGGNILGRGVTIENLLVTYYLREPKIGQMDTMLQHARMYGYRSKLMHLTRVFLPEQLAVRFHEIHGIERRLRRQLMTADMNKQIVVEKASSLNPTRSSVLDPTFMDAFDAEEQVFPKYPAWDMDHDEFARISGMVQKLGGNVLAKKAEPVEISFESILELVDTFPYGGEGTSWHPGVLRRVLERQRERVKDRAYLYTRMIARKKEVFATGAVSGKELQDLRLLDGPVFCAFRDDGKENPYYQNIRIWYPTLIFDSKMPSLILNVTPDEN